eukprot:TRINITY_DN3514_c0_g2_i1.p1 TRINITY_DN3514_c0_g2~~TRINITY_DN3514_c0_g2_i1.p1  ORF type:complete len:174 (+),score=39.05 TRINITY_DN3514_c0_g2_i1:94-615(+)
MESHDHQSHRNHSWTPKTPSKKSAKRATSPSQLKERLKDRRLKVGGLKSDLLKRLKEWRDREKAKESEDHYDAQDSEPLKKKNKASNHRECESQGSESEEESEASVEISDGGNSDEEERKSLGLMLHLTMQMSRPRSLNCLKVSTPSTRSLEDVDTTIGSNTKSYGLLGTGLQ